jgi:hypothetical protein
MGFTPEARMKAAETRRMNAEARRAEKISAQGFGESKIFCDPNAPDPYEMIRNCHIEGKRIGDHYTDHQIAALRWEWTDEGYAARNEGKSATRASVISDPLAKALEQRRDDVKERGMETWQATNPMQEVLDANQRPGFRRRFLSDQTVKNRGMRGWKPVIENGDPVKLGTMTLAEMPESHAAQRNKHYQGMGNDRLKAVTESYVQSGGTTAVSDQ